MKKAEEILARLREGNRRFVAQTQTGEFSTGSRRPYELVQEHAPAAIIVGCSDARVPAELIFDQGVGDLFVVRIAGNIVAPSQIGSVEFAAEMFGAPLVVVLGHENCGAVAATLESCNQPGESLSPNLKTIVDFIRPAIEPLLDGEADPRDEDLMSRAVRANIEASVEQLRHGSEIIEKLIEQNRLRIVGAEFSLQTGQVEFFDGS